MKVPLTKREIEILQYMEKGFSAQEISDSLFISAATTSKHQQNIKEKLDAKNLAQALVMGLKEIESKNSLVKEIEFPINLVEAGLSLLNLFTRIVTKKYPLGEIKIKIEQNNNQIRFIIFSKNGEILESIEQDLVIFGQILNGQADPRELINDENEIRLLREKLRFVSLELEMTKKIVDSNSIMLKSQERDKMLLFNLLDKNMHLNILNHKRIKELTELSSKEYKSIHDLIERIKIEIEKKETNSELLLQALNELKKAKPTQAKKIGLFLLDVAKETTKSIISDWIKSLL